MARFPSALDSPPSLRREPALDSCDITTVGLSDVKVSIRFDVAQMRSSTKLGVGDVKTSTKPDTRRGEEVLR